MRKKRKLLVQQSLGGKYGKNRAHKNSFPFRVSEPKTLQADVSQALVSASSLRPYKQFYFNLEAVYCDMHKNLWKHLLICLLTLGIIACGNSQTSSKQLVGNPNRDIPLLLKTGNHKADIMDSLKMSPKMMEITMRLQRAFQENYSWFVDYMKNVPEGQPLPYHEKMGISKTEYEEFLHAGENTEVVPSAIESLAIQKSGEVISFKGTGRLVIFDSIKIDLLKQTATFRNFKLSQLDSIRITDDKNGLRSKWFGYTFSFEEPKNISPDQIKDLASFTYTKLN